MVETTIHEARDASPLMLIPKSEVNGTPDWIRTSDLWFRR